MNRVKVILCYGLALLMLPAVLMLFINWESWRMNLGFATGLTVSPRFTGGAVEHYIDRGDYQIQIHRPVFDGLITQRRDGFVQVDWTPIGRVPKHFEEPIDFDQDGQVDFVIRWDTNNGVAELSSSNPEIVVGIREVLKLTDAWSVRIKLKRY
jgi:hypothetical protein